VLLLGVRFGVGHVQPKHIHACGDQRGQLLSLSARRADRRHDFRAGTPPIFVETRRSPRRQA
jgi:hypothetical protein